MSDKKKIIIIDDEADVRTFLTTLLEDNGYDPIQANDGVQGLDMVKAEKPDVILLDITMPEKSGVRFYRDVREDDNLKSIPVIMVTGVQKEFEKFISTRRKVPPPEGYISKPIDTKALLEKIAEVLV